MDERFYDSLELNKILEMLSKECSNEKTKKMALGIKPCSDLYTVKKETGKTAEALELSVSRIISSQPLSSVRIYMRSSEK